MSCSECNSTNVTEKNKNFLEDLHNVVKIISCNDCGHEDSVLVNIQEEQNV